MTTSAAEEWITAMHAADFERAWQISDRELRERAARAAAKHSGPRHLQQIWHGEPLAGARVLVRCYHGLGDTLQFIRFAAPLSRIAREVIVWCQPKLMGLVSRVAGVHRVLPLHDGVVEAEFDVDIEIMELPHALRITAAALDRDVPYLATPADPTREIKHALQVGVVWEAGEWNPRRSIPPSLFAPLAAISGVELPPLQPGAVIGGRVLRDLPSIDVLATRMAGLDLIVSVDTMAAHLAGALGFPVWTLLQADCDWRWGRVGDRSPWYPTMRLFRQVAPGDWSVPLLQLERALKACREQWCAHEHRNECSPRRLLP